jgi:hypothetical protein
MIRDAVVALVVAIIVVEACKLLALVFAVGDFHGFSSRQRLSAKHVCTGVGRPRDRGPR